MSSNREGRAQRRKKCIWAISEFSVNFSVSELFAYIVYKGNFPFLTFPYPPIYIYLILNVTRYSIVFSHIVQLPLRIGIASVLRTWEEERNNAALHTPFFCGFLIGKAALPLIKTHI